MSLWAISVVIHPKRYKTNWIFVHIDKCSNFGVSTEQIMQFNVSCKARGLKGQRSPSSI